MSIFRILLLVIFAVTFAFNAVSAAKANEDMRFENVCLGNSFESCYIRAVGAITADTVQVFERYMKTDHTDGKKVLFDSPGGNLFSGLELGRAIRKHKLDTVIGTLSKKGEFWDLENNGQCYSACAYAFAGGGNRTVLAGNKLGVHQFYNAKRPVEREIQNIETALPKAISTTQVITGLVAGYLADMGVDARVLMLAATAGADQIYVLDETELSQYGFVTPFGFSAWELEAYGKGAVAFSKKRHQSGPYDEISQVTVFCRGNAKDKYLLLTNTIGIDHLSSGNDRFPGLIVVKQGARSRSFEIPISDVSFIKQKNGGAIQLRINDNVISEMLNADEVMARLDTPRAWGGNHAFTKLTLQDRRTISVALRVCI